MQNDLIAENHLQHLHLQLSSSSLPHFAVVIHPNDHRVYKNATRLPPDGSGRGPSMDAMQTSRSFQNHPLKFPASRQSSFSLEQ
jgi:hypothetical protein